MNGDTLPSLIPIDYGAFLVPALAITACSAPFVIWVFLRYSYRPLGGILDWFLLPLFAMATCVAVFSSVYSIGNFLVQSEISGTQLLREELATGVIGLRVTSILLGMNTILRVFTQLIRYSNLQRLRIVNATMGSDDLEEWDRDRGSGGLDGLSTVLTKGDMDRIQLAQNSLYLSILACLWAGAVMGIESLAMATLSWSLFFIVDDWLIIVSTMRKLKGRILLGTSLRIGVFNCLLLSLLLYVLDTDFHLPVAFTIGAGALLFVLMFWRYYPTWFSARALS